MTLKLETFESISQKLRHLFCRSPDRIFSQYSLLHMDITDMTFLVKDTRMRSVHEVSLIPVSDACDLLYCKTCLSSRCYHALFVSYTHEIGVVRTLRLVNNKTNRTIELIKPTLKTVKRNVKEILTRHYLSIIQFSTVVSLIFLMISPGIIPIFFDAMDGSWHIWGYYLDGGFTLATPHLHI